MNVCPFATIYVCACVFVESWSWNMAVINCMVEIKQAQFN